MLLAFHMSIGFHQAWRLHVPQRSISFNSQEGAQKCVPRSSRARSQERDVQLSDT